jgi:hypothetical protein
MLEFLLICCIYAWWFMKLFEIILELFGWLQIVVGVTLAAGLLAFATYLIWNNRTGKIAGIMIISIGFIAGVIWATIIWKKHGTIAWLSGIRRIS